MQCTIHFRHKRLSESEEFQIFVGKVEEEEAWMNEKQQILSSDNFGENMAGVQGLVKKHDAFVGDLALHTQRINQLIQEGQNVSTETFWARKIDELGFFSSVSIVFFYIFGVYFIFFQLIDAGNHHAPAIEARCAQLRTRLKEIEDLARRRLLRLQDNSAYLQFMWKCDVVESWIG